MSRARTVGAVRCLAMNGNRTPAQSFRPAHPDKPRCGSRQSHPVRPAGQRSPLRATRPGTADGCGARYRRAARSAAPPHGCSRDCGTAATLPTEPGAFPRGRPVTCSWHGFCLLPGTRTIPCADRAERRPNACLAGAGRERILACPATRLGPLVQRLRAAQVGQLVQRIRQRPARVCVCGRSRVIM